MYNGIAYNKKLTTFERHAYCTRKAFRFYNLVYMCPIHEFRVEVDKPNFGSYKIKKHYYEIMLTNIIYIDPSKTIVVVIDIIMLTMDCGVSVQILLHRPN